jgi:hypothetical protein
MLKCLTFILFLAALLAFSTQENITEYKIVLNGTTADALERQVNRYIKQGYQPVGGLAVSEGTFFQAMAK